jgi:hypothetical protein
MSYKTPSKKMSSSSSSSLHKEQVLEDEFMYTVERIVQHDNNNGKMKYFVKWEGYGDEENTWEDREDLILDGHDKAVKEYEEKILKKKSSTTANSNRARSKTPPSRKAPPTSSTKKSKTPRRLNLDPPSKKPEETLVPINEETDEETVVIKSSNNKKPLTWFLISLFLIIITSAIALHAEEFQEQYAIAFAQVTPFLASCILLQSFKVEDTVVVFTSRACLWAAFHALLISGLMSPVPYLTQLVQLLYQVDIARSVGANLRNTNAAIVTAVVWYLFAFEGGLEPAKQVITLTGLWGAISGVDRWAENRTLLNFMEAVAACFALIAIHSPERVWQVGAMGLLTQSVVSRLVLRA